MAETEMSYIQETALNRITELLDLSWLTKPPVWLLGGSSGLLLHGVALNRPPSDIDLYGDLEDAVLLHQALSCFSADNGPEEDFSGNCYSRRSRYVVDGVKVELVCGFRIGTPPYGYAVDVHALQRYASVCGLSSHRLVLLMPLAHELLFNLLRGKIERCRDIALRMQGDLQFHVPLIHELSERNGLEESLRAELFKLLLPPTLQPPETEFRKEAAL